MTDRNETNFSLIICLKKVDQYVEKLIRSQPHGLILSNLIFGLISLIFAINGFYRFSSLCIISSVFCHYFDVRLSRLVRIPSDRNVQLNSLANIISFGVAPTILAHSIRYCSILMIIAFITFPFACVWRLSKSPVNPTDEYSIGFPISIAALIIALLALISLVSPLLMIGLAMLIISPIVLPKL